MFKLIILTCLLAAVTANRYALIEEHQKTSQEDGSYQYTYRTSNDIAAQEAGVGGVIAQGTAQWYSPEGEGVQFAYVADHNGYTATGTHIPVAPPVPEYILRAAEWAKTHPYHDEWTKPEDLVWRDDTNEH